MARPQTTPQDLSNKLNTLESAIVNAEESAEDARWQQASIVVQMLDAGQTQKQVAAGWHNGRTGKPYAVSHVNAVKQVWQRWGVQFTERDRPDWTTAYYTIQQGADEVIEPEQRRSEWSRAHEARAPRSEETAERLVQNILKEAPGVVETVYRGLHEGREGRYVEPVGRQRQNKEADAFASDVGAPVVDALSKLNVVLHLEQAIEELRDMSMIDRRAYDQIGRLLEDLRQEAEVKYAMAEVQS